MGVQRLGSGGFGEGSPDVIEIVFLADPADNARS